jgi:FkbM family methyltransferase
MSFAFVRPLLQRLHGGRLISRFNFTTTARVNDREVRVPLLAGVGYENLGVSEWWLDTLLQRLFRHTTGAFIDVGTNVGQTLLKVKTLAPDIQYVGFEPNPVCFHYTQRLVSLNKFQNCTVVPVGLFSRAALLPFFAQSDTDVSGSVVEGFRPTGERPQMMHVPVFDGDSVLEVLGWPKVGVLKIDVEGGELDVIEGLRGTIRRDRPFVICEILPLFSTNGPRGRFRKPRQDRLLADMRDEGYVMYRILEDATAQPLTDIELHVDMKLTNYLFAPAEAAPLIDREMSVESTTSHGTA